MSVTRIDCQIFRPDKARGDLSSYVAFNPSGMPGSFVVANAHAAREGIGAQVACKLSLEHFVDGVLEYFSGEIGVPEGDISLAVLESAFKKANSSVYEFGHKLAAGGRLSASMLGIVVEDNTIAAGRVGTCSAYLFRENELFPFFETLDPKDISEDDFVGAKSLVTVELASVPVQAGDRIFAFSSVLTEINERKLNSFAANMTLESMDECKNCVEAVFGDKPPESFSMVAEIGPNTIYLSEVIG
ncbi:MAG: hypothetical protein KDD56_07020 [Bdellovibrionales bacterium]|nr:hypothetical protein [Bdellovibrionales bacterium]